MWLWDNPRWFNAQKRREQLDAHIQATGAARFGLKQLQENEKEDAVCRHFNRVAPKYDFMNSLLSFGIQHAWKRAAMRLLNVRRGQRVLDVCGGTGDLAILAAKKTGAAGRVIIYDINRAMLAAGRHKIDPVPQLGHISYVQANAEQLTFADNTFDRAMVGFGIRNLTHLEKGFQEIYRVLKPGGRFLCLEFSQPLNPIFRSLYDFYSFNIMPALGQLIAGSAESYACLPETIRMFPLPDELSDILRDIGFQDISWRPLTNAIAVAHIAVKPNR